MTFTADCFGILSGLLVVRHVFIKLCLLVAAIFENLGSPSIISLSPADLLHSQIMFLASKSFDVYSSIPSTNMH